MNEKTLRWKARIGSLKFGCLIVLIGAVILACVGISGVMSAINNPDEPQAVTVSQLVNDEVQSGRYVSVSGLAAYELGYEKTEDGSVTETYYFIVDSTSGDMVLVKHDAPMLVAKKTGEATVVGMTRRIPTDLKEAVEEDTSVYAKNDLQTTTDLYVADGQKPADLGGSAVILAVGGVVAALSIVPLFFPGTVFAAYPLDPNAQPPAERGPIKATGKFRKLKSMEPLEIGKGTRNFSNAVANVIPRGERDLMVYIHYILRTKTYGITVNKQETDWGAFINDDNVQRIEAGKIYGWKDKWAVRFQYQDEKGKSQTLFVIFESTGTQVDFVNLLQKMGFEVVTGEVA